MEVKLVHITPDAERYIAYCARVSSAHQDTLKYESLLKYMIKHKHWSPFEMASMCLEITTSRAISAQILRHRSFSFQEFSQRYSDDIKFESVNFRRQDLTNRQNSIEDETLNLIAYSQDRVLTDIEDYYKFLLKEGVAKECARMILPMCTQTKLYMYGSVRSWIHYIEVRTDKDTQKEHREVAQACKNIFMDNFPATTVALDWEVE
jgi:thymidylate synthase (FAD)